MFSKWLPTADEFWIVQVTGGEARKLGSVSGHAYGLTFHPNGKQLGFNILQSSYELWALENFMPAADAETNR